MSRHQRLAENFRSSRRTIADVIDILANQAGFATGHLATIDVGAMQLPSMRIVGVVQVFYRTTDTTYIVSLPTSSTFHAVRAEAARREEFCILDLSGAKVGADGHVELLNGVRLGAVVVTPALLPLEPSPLDWRIVHATVAALKAEERCYRRLTDTGPPHGLFLDCSELSSLSTPPLKELLYRVWEVDPTLNTVSGQKVSNTLRMFGLRIPAPRPRRARRS